MLLDLRTQVQRCNYGIREECDLLVNANVMPHTIIYLRQREILGKTKIGTFPTKRKKEKNNSAPVNENGGEHKQFLLLPFLFHAIQDRH